MRPKACLEAKSMIIKPRCLFDTCVLFTSVVFTCVLFMCVLCTHVVREVNFRVLGKGLELLSANGGRFEINQLLFADDAALVADSEEKLC